MPKYKEGSPISMVAASGKVDVTIMIHERGGRSSSEQHSTVPLIGYAVVKDSDGDTRINPVFLWNGVPQWKCWSDIVAVRVIEETP